MGKSNFLVWYTLAVVVATVLATVLTNVLWQQYSTNNLSAEITPMVVVQRMQNQSFLVSKTIYLDKQVKLNIETGSEWSNFFWGKEIEARGLVRVDFGIDFANLTDSNVEIISEENKIVLRTNPPEVLDASVTRELVITTGGSILRQLFASDANEDYRLSSERLVLSATEDVESDESLRKEALENAEKLLNYLFQDLDYSVDLVTGE